MTVGDDDDVPGSSPRMRGALSHGMRRWSIKRIIPAYAGSTSTWGKTGCSRGDHPRVCGEHAHGWAGRIVRVWIIPAYAGSTHPRCA